MKKINKITVALGIALMLGVVGLFVAFAATDPGLGEADSFSIIAQTAITGTGTISGDVGMNSTSDNITALTPADVGGTIYSTDGVAPAEAILDPQVQADLSAADLNISGQGSDGSIGPALDGLTVEPGVWDIGAGRLNGGVVTLDGSGTYIFRASSDFISSGSVELTNGARACDVYWQVDSLATINGSSFLGTIIAGTGVHFGDGVALNGRALALGGDVTLLNNTISGPTCATPPVEEEEDSGSGGTTPIPPIIDIVKVPSPLALSDGPGAVEYTYTLNNNGTEPVLDVEVVDDSCSSVELVSGDTNDDAILDVNETWEYTCSTTLSETHTNTVTATGRSPYGLIATDTAEATVVVDVEVVPPLIHVTKVPNPLALSAEGGAVTYTNEVTNPGEVALSNVQLTDNQCGPVEYVSGDTNGDDLLDIDETWTYTCSANITETTDNTVTASGDANGLTATDTALVTVVVDDVATLNVVKEVINDDGGTAIASDFTIDVSGTNTSPSSFIGSESGVEVTLDSGSYEVTETGLQGYAQTYSDNCSGVIAPGETRTCTITNDDVVVPQLPDTGIPPSENNIPWNIVVPAGILTALISLYLTRGKQAE